MPARPVGFATGNNSIPEKFFSPFPRPVVAMLQAAAPLAAKPLFGFTYRATVATFPGAFLLLVSSVALPCACALFAVTWGLKGRDVAAALGVPIIGSLQRTFLKALQSNLFHVLGQISTLCPVSTTEGKIKVCMWLREISSCSRLTVLPGPAWVLLSKTCNPLFAPL